MLKLSIPVPCHEDWNTMLPNESGRHCSACSKTVIDFTGMNDEELLHFISSNKNKKVCGRLKTEQIHSIKISLPPNILQSQRSWWKHFLVAVLFAFGSTLFSCQFSIMEDQITQGILLPEHPLLPPPPPTGNIIYWEEADSSMSAEYSTDKGDIEIIIVDSAEKNSEIIQIVSPLTDSLISDTADKLFKSDSSFIQPAKPVNKKDSTEREIPISPDAEKCDSIPTVFT